MLVFTKREKVFTGIIGFLILVVIFLLIKIVDYKIDLFVYGGHKYGEPPSMEESIRKSSMIFICKKEIHNKLLKYRIEEIIYRDDRYEFPYKLGELFPRLQEKYNQDFYYGEGQLVILSSKPRVRFQRLQIVRGVITGFGDISIDDFIKNVKTIKGLN